MNKSAPIPAHHIEAYASVLRSLAGSYAPEDEEPVDFAEGYEAARIDLARGFATICEDSNPEFDRIAFLTSAAVPT